MDGSLEAARLRGRYLDVVKRALTHMLYRPLDVNWHDPGYVEDEELRKSVEKELAKPDFNWTDIRTEGRDWPWFAQTMVGTKRLDNVQECVERVLADGVPGDLIETGVWRGGVAIFMRALLDAHDDRERVVFAADSFAGLPPPDEAAFPADAGSLLYTAAQLAVSRADVEQNFELYGLLDERVRFLEGWFKDTLPTVRDHTWSVVRLDGDMYESTIEGLTNLYPGLSVGGFLIVDDYRTAQGITEPILSIDWLGAYWRKAR